ncbi:MAG: hypothetical protein AAFV25_16230, partial [Bacteroidota bacterium]
MSLPKPLPALFALLFCLSCQQGKDGCPPRLFLGEFELSEQTRQWDAYQDHTSVVFEDVDGQEHVLAVSRQQPLPVLVNMETVAICEDDDNKIITYQHRALPIEYSLDLLPGTSDDKKLKSISYKLEPVLHTEQIEEKRVGDFLRISHLVPPYGFSGGNLMQQLIDPKNHPELDNPYIEKLETHSSNGQLYENVYTNRAIPFAQSWIEMPVNGAIFG